MEQFENFSFFNVTNFQKINPKLFFVKTHKWSKNRVKVKILGKNDLKTKKKLNKTYSLQMLEMRCSNVS